MEITLEYGIGVEKIVGTSKDIFVQNCLQETLNHYPDLVDEKIVVSMRFPDLSSNCGVSISRKRRINYIDGTFPSEVLENKYAERILIGVFGHEFGHLANGDLNLGEFSDTRILYSLGRDGDVNSAKGLLSYDIDVEEMLRRGKKVFRNIERRADETAIDRGLGLDLFLFRVYSENHRERFGGTINEEYYTSQQIKKLIKRNV